MEERCFEKSVTKLSSFRLKIKCCNTFDIMIEACLSIQHRFQSLPILLRNIFFSSCLYHPPHHVDYDAYNSYVSFHFNAAIDRFTIIYCIYCIGVLSHDSWVSVYGEFIPHRQCDLDMLCSYHWYDLMWDWFKLRNDVKCSKKCNIV